MIRLAILAIAAAAACATSASALDYRFESAKDASDFKVFGAKWQVKGKAYGPVAGIALPTPSLLTRGKFGRVSARASIDSLKTFARAGVMARARVDGTLLYGYFGGLSRDSDAATSARLLRFDRYNIKTSQGVQLALCQAPVKLEAKKNIELRAVGSSLALYYNGALVCSAKDASYGKGRAGLMASPLPSGGTASSFARAIFED